MKIFSGSVSTELSKKIAKHLDCDLSLVEISVFPDKERRIKLKENVLGKDTFVIQSTGQSPDENYMELFLLIDALKRSGAKSIKVAIPYLGYQRQDHIFRDGEAVSSQVIAEILEKVGMTELFSFDFHTPKIAEMFSVPVHHLSALPVFSEKIKNDFDTKEIVLVSPDMGGIRRIKQISAILSNIPFATIIKNRDLNTGNISDSGLDGDVRGKIAIMVDDMISTGTTMAEACDLLLENGALKVYAFATHAILAKDASDVLQKSKIEKIFVSDTIDILKEKQFAKLEILSITEIAAKALKNF